jgi:small subunit ribosomal protein S16
LVTLRLRREGKKKQPIYRIVLADSRSSRAGKYIQAIGYYNPLVNPMVVEVNEAKLFSWLKRGARPTDTMRSLLQRKGLWLKWTLLKRGADEAKIAAELEKWQMLQADKMRREGEKKDRRKTLKKQKAAAEKPAVPAPAAEAAAPAPEAAAPAPEAVALAPEAAPKETPPAAV